MMKVVQINLSCTWGSTGKICNAISELLTETGFENYIFYIYGNNPQKKSNYIKFGNRAYTKFQILKSRIFGNYGFNSSIATKLMIKKLEQIKPDIVHLHNIHDGNCNFGMLFEYLKVKKIKVVYTFHDCWAFTGYCPHFTMAKCDRWKSGCGDCPQRRNFSWFFDKSDIMFERKKQALTELDMVIVTPSRWLSKLAGQSFLKNCPIEVINNGIDLSIFKPTNSMFKEKYNLQNQKIVLGVSSLWWKAKGLDVFIRLANELPPSYKVVLIGTDDKVDKVLPDNVLSIHRTQNQHELAEIYSAADVFVNPTREENYPTTNMEAIACGTPVLTFETGGSPETLDERCGSVVECDDVEALKTEIIRICTKSPYIEEDCIKRSFDYNQHEKYKEYLKLYERIIASRN